MAFRSDINVNWELSPRLIEVEAPSVEVTIQDLYDTLRILEARVENTAYDSIISAGGKEELGGGVLVGVTATLQNARLGFEDRPSSFTSGTATAGTGARVIVDSGATFITDGVVVDDLVRNDTQDGWSTVLRVDSETQLTVTSLTPPGPWASGDNYTIWHVIQCNVSGGNLVAVDDVGAEINSIYPTGFVQVVRTSSSSATLQELEDIQFASFEGGVWIDATTPNTGTTFPTGTPRQPVNNVTDAITIANNRGLPKLFIIGDYTFLSSDDVSGFEIIGQSESLSTLTFNAGSTTTGTEIREATVTGTVDGLALLEDCLVTALTDTTVAGGSTMVFRRCDFAGTLTCSASNTGEAHFINCLSGVPGTATPIFDMNGADIDVLFRNYAGDMEIRNFSNVANNSLSIDMNAGKVVLDSTCTTGTIIIRGIATLTDNTAGTIVLTSGMVFADAIQQSSFEQFVFIDVVNGSTGTKYPKGTHADPVNNLADAKTIANDRGLNNLLIEGTLVIGASDNIDNFLLKGVTAATSVISLTSGCSTDATQFEDITLTGAVNGDIIVRRSGIQNLTNVGDDGLGTTITECAILDAVSPAIQLRSGLVGPKPLHILNCSSFSSSGDGPVIDMNGSGTSVIMNQWNGHFELQNYTGGQTSSITANSGTITLDSTCTTGTVRLSGTGNLQDNSVGLTIIDELLDHDDVHHLVVNELTVGSGSTDTEVRTNATQADNFYDGMLLVVVNSAGTVARNIQSYAQLNGAFTLATALPFTPSVNDRVVIFGQQEFIDFIVANAALIPASL